MLGNTNANDIILPNLTNPATAEQILTGYQAIDGEGNLIIGTASAPATMVYGTITASEPSNTIDLGFEPDLLIVNSRDQHNENIFVLNNNTGRVVNSISSNCYASMKLDGSSLYAYVNRTGVTKDIEFLAIKL